ncbi:MAG TPA: PAS domain S-box protein, partial [Geobacterales bacterium]|nr:PAS domain S-box protein [Geobacterales bacterium]
MVRREPTEQKTSGSTGLLAAIVNSSFDAIIGKTLEGTVTSWNPAAAKLFGYDPGEMIGASIRRLIPVDRQDEEDQMLSRIKTGEQVESYETVRLRKNGDPIDVFLTSSPIWGPDGKIIGASKIVRDVTSQKKAAETLRQSEERLRLFVEQAPAAIAMFDRNMRYMACSDRWLPVHGRTEQSVIGRSHYEVFPEIPEGWKEVHRRGMAGEVVCSEEDAFPRADGRTQWVRWELRPWLTGDQTVGGITIMAEDVTERVEAVRALRENELRTRLAQEAAKVGTWELRLADNLSQWSQNIWGLYGLKPGHCTPSFESWTSSIHPDDRERNTKSLREAVAIGREYEVQWRVNLPEGEPERWLLSRGRPVTDANGVPERYIGVVIDITEQKRAEEALQKAEERERQKREELEAVLAALPVAVIITKDAASVEMTGNQAAHELLRVPVNSSLSKSAPPEQVPNNFEMFSKGRLLSTDELPIQKAASTKTIVHAEELEIRFAEGDSRIALCNALPLFDAEGGVRGVVCVLTDITELKRTEAALRNSEEYLQFALEAANAGTWEVELSTGKFAASDGALYFLGIAPGTSVTLDITLSRVHPDDRPRLEEGLRHTLETGKPYRAEWRALLPDGSIRWLETRGERRFASGKQLIGGLLQDITERKRAEQTLREREELLDSIIEHVPVPIILWREDRKVLLMNPALTKLTGYTASDIPTRDEWEALAYRDDAPQGTEDFRRTFESGRPIDLGDRWVHTKSGEKRLWSLTRAPAGQDASGRRLVVGVAVDITERRKSEEEALATKSKLEAALAAMRDGVFILDAESRYIHFNEAFAKFHKYRSKEDSVQTFAELPAILNFFLPSGEWVPRGEWPSQRALRGETEMNAEYTIKQREGEPYIGSYNFAPIRDSSGHITGAVVSVRDITEQKRAANRLRESEARLSSIIDTAGDSIVVIDEKGIIQSANRATEGIFGYGLKDLVGRNIGILMVPNLAAQHDRYIKGFSGRGAVREVGAKRKDGTMVPIDGTVAEWQDGEGRRFFTGILRDLTERKRNEEVLANARRLEAVGQLAGGVAHDFNNLLHVISGNLDIAQDFIDDETTRTFLERARNAAEKGSALNGRLLSLARKRALKVERLDLNDRVQEIAKLLASTVGEHIAVTTDLATGLWMTLADAGEIDSAILNLVANARDAMPGGGNVRISTSNVTLDAAAVKLHRKAAPGDYVRLAIADSGVGMPEDVLDKATEAFFTTKEPGAGTGLGLTSVESFASQMGGFM